MNSETSLDKRLQELAQRINGQICTQGVDDAVAKELGYLVNLLPEIDKAGSMRLLEATEIAVSAILTEKPNIALVKSIRKNVKRKTGFLNAPFWRVLRSGTPATQVILGLATLLFVLSVVSVVVVTEGDRFLTLTLPSQAQLFGIDVSLLILVALAGALGGMVSIMARIQDFAQKTNVDSSVLFFTGLFKPVVGMAFAMFVFAVIEGGVLPLAVILEKKRYFFMALAFVSGFSERFARDVVSKVEDRVGSP